MATAHPLGQPTGAALVGVRGMTTAIVMMAVFSALIEYRVPVPDEHRAAGEPSGHRTPGRSPP